MQNKGFTLIEISIVLVIIGLLTGAVLKGQQMIENTRYKAWVKEVKALRTAIYAFQDRYRALPGDMRDASTRLPSVGGVSGVNGDGNGVIHQAIEARHALHHLILAGFISGDASCSNIADCYPAVPVGGFYGYLMTDSFVSGRMSVRAGYYNIPSHHAKRYDEEFDDGKANAGAVVCNAPNSIVPANCTGNENWPEDDKTTSLLIEM